MALQAQGEIGAEQALVGQGRLQRRAQGRGTEQGIAEQAVAGDAQPPAQQQPQFGRRDG